MELQSSRGDRHLSNDHIKRSKITIIVDAIKERCMKTLTRAFDLVGIVKSVLKKAKLELKLVVE